MNSRELELTSSALLDVDRLLFLPFSITHMEFFFFLLLLAALPCPVMERLGQQLLLFHFHLIFFLFRGSCCQDQRITEKKKRKGELDHGVTNQMRMSDRRRYIERAQRVRGRTAIAVQQTVHVISSYQLYYSRNEAKGAGGIELRQLFGPFYISFAGRGRFVDLSGNFLLLSFHFLFFFEMGRSDARCVTPPKDKETQGNKDLALDIFATASQGLVDIIRML